MIQVIADKTNSLHRKGEIVTKLNKRGETFLRNTLHAKVNKLRKIVELQGTARGTNTWARNSYQDALGVYVALFGRRPYGH